MKKYDDYKMDKSELGLTREELININWTKYKIIVPTEHDKEELEAAFEHIHYSNIDTDFVTVNQLAHEYLNNNRIEGSHNNIIVDYDLFKSVEDRKG
jgi:aminopeptidase-like protein